MTIYVFTSVMGIHQVTIQISCAIKSIKFVKIIFKLQRNFSITAGTSIRHICEVLNFEVFFFIVFNWKARKIQNLLNDTLMIIIGINANEKLMYLKARD